MKKIILPILATLLLAACGKNNAYTIQGSFDFPKEFEMGDSTITRGAIEGYVYLVDLTGMPMDSAEIQNETFTLTGLVDPKMPYFAYIYTEYGAGMVAIEPGDIQVSINDATLIATGTPSNDKISAMMAHVDTIGFELYSALQAAQEMKQIKMGDNKVEGEDSGLTEEEIYPIYEKYSNRVNDYIQEVYQQNKENLVGIYCANVSTAQVQSSAEMEQNLAPYSDYVKNSELIQEHLKYLRSIESQYANGEDNLGD